MRLDQLEESGVLLTDVEDHDAHDGEIEEQSCGALWRTNDQHMLTPRDT